MKNYTLLEALNKELHEKNEFVSSAQGTDYYFHKRKDEDLNEELYRLLVGFFKKNGKHKPKRIDITW